MPTSTIPFDPSFVLGMVVDPGRITVLEEVANAQKAVDAKRDYVNALIRQKLSIDMTARELISLGATDDQLGALADEQKQLLDAIIAAAGDLGTAVIEAEQEIVAIKSTADQQQIGVQIQSPVDFQASQLQSMPLSSDSMDMDVQYFRFEDNEQKDTATASAISAYVGAKVGSFLGFSFGAKAAHSSNSSVNNTLQTHKLVGTLVICANCTSRQAQVFSPLKLDPDLAIEAYKLQTNDDMPGEKDPEAMKELALADTNDIDPKMSIPILSGASYGSSFVGFVHFVRNDDSSSHQTSDSTATQVRVEVESEEFLGGIEGSFGLDKQTANTLKELMSSVSIQSHCSVITMGLIPSITSNKVITSLQAIKDDPQKQMQELAALQGATNTANQSIAASAAASKKGKSLQSMKADFISAAISAVSDVDQATNNVIDLNSLMVALDDYVKKAGDGKIGVPINFYIRYVTKKDVAKLWMQTYYPDLLHEKTMEEEEEGDDDNS